MDDFTPEEREALRGLLEYGDEFQEMMALKGARRLLFKTYRSILIGTAGLVVAGVTLWEHFLTFLRGLIQ